MEKKEKNRHFSTFIFLKKKEKIKHLEQKFQNFGSQFKTANIFLVLSRFLNNEQKYLLNFIFRRLLSKKKYPKRARNGRYIILKKSIFVCQKKVA